MLTKKRRQCETTYDNRSALGSAALSAKAVRKHFVHKGAHILPAMRRHSPDTCPRGGRLNRQPM